MSSRLSAPLLIVVAAIAGGLGLWSAQRYFAAPVGPAGAAAASYGAALMYPEPRAVVPFRLLRGGGGAFTDADLKGRWSLLFFGFTHCPDVCPTTLGVFAQVHRKLAATRPTADVQMVFVSVDPERDTPDKVAEYAKYFDPDIVGVTGDADTLLALTPGLGVVYMKSPLPNGDYTVDHSANAVLIDPEGRMAGLFRPPLDAGKIADDLVKIAAGNK